MHQRIVTAADVVVLILIALLVLTVFWPSVGSRELSPRTICAANLKGIANGFATYAVANDGYWPIPAHMPAQADEVGLVRYAPGKIGTKRGTTGKPESGCSTEQESELSSTRAFWELVRAGSGSPKSFICPLSKDKWNDEQEPQDFWDFRGYNEISYGYQVPFGKHGRVTDKADADMAVMADKGPFGAAIEAGIRNPGVPTLTSKSEPNEWKPWNSPNHKGEGQNVGYVDGHVNFVLTPLAGWKKDNIYTRWSQADADKDENELARVQGTPPTGIETPWGDTDSLIYP